MKPDRLRSKPYDAQMRSDIVHCMLGKLSALETMVGLELPGTVAQSTCCAMSTYYLSCAWLHASEWTSRLREGSRWDRKFSSIFPNSCPEEMVQGTRWQKARHATEDGLCVV